MNHSGYRSTIFL